MKSDCSQYRGQIPDLLLGELPDQARKALEQHLGECRPCAEERELFAAAIGELRTLGDVPVPRHFFVTAEEPRRSPWSLYLQLSTAWRVSLAGAAAVLCLVAVLASARFQVRAEDGMLVLGFGRLPALAQSVVAVPAPPVDTAALQAEIVRVLEEKNRRENLEWVRTLRAEIGRSNRTLTEQQKTVLQSALAGLENRMDDRLAATARALEEGTKQSLDSLYQAVSLDREKDYASTRALINRVALNTEAKSSQTDVILDTLLQVADLRTRQ